MQAHRQPGAWLLGHTDLSRLNQHAAPPPPCRYPVRMALVQLDRPPAWFKRTQAGDHMTADEARAFAGTDGAALRCSPRPAAVAACIAAPCAGGSQGLPKPQCSATRHAGLALAPTIAQSHAKPGWRVMMVQVRPCCGRACRRPGAPADQPGQRRLHPKPHLRLLLPPSERRPPRTCHRRGGPAPGQLAESPAPRPAASAAPHTRTQPGPVVPCANTPPALSTQVTNTPWAERVTFVFRPVGGERVGKALHVSPLMDMEGTW